MKGIDYYYPANPDMNTPPIDDYKKKIPRTFWHENCVTIAHMNQGKTIVPAKMDTIKNR